MKLTVALLTAISLLPAQFRSEARLVEVYATVFDHNGHPVDGLAKERFQISENGVAQEIHSFEPASGDLSCAILLDTTGSMKEALGAVKNAVSGFLDEMRPGDSAGVFAFSTSLVTLHDFTTDRAAVKRAVLRTRASGETALFDAIAQLSDEIQSRPGKKVIILFTDGADNASHLMAQAATRRAFTNGVPVYAIAEGDAVRDGELLKQLKNVAEKSGGVCYRARSSHDVANVFSDILADLKHVYLLTYKPSRSEDKTWRAIQISIAGMKDYKIRGKQGYFPE